MTLKHAAKIMALVSVFVSSIWIHEGGTAMTKTYHMLFSGDAGAHFSGKCALKTSGGETVLALDGQVPHEQEVVGHGLSCQIEADGRVVVDIEHNGSRTRSSTNGGRINIGLR